MTLLEYLDTPESAGPEELIFGALRARLRVEPLEGRQRQQIQGHTVSTL